MTKEIKIIFISFMAMAMIGLLFFEGKWEFLGAFGLCGIFLLLILDAERDELRQIRQDGDLLIDHERTIASLSSEITSITTKLDSFQISAEKSTELTSDVADLKEKMKVLVDSNNQMVMKLSMGAMSGMMS